MSYGGQVVIGSVVSEVMGWLVVWFGDMCICLIVGYQVCFIVEGDLQVIVDGKLVVFDGYKMLCGVMLILSLVLFGWE